VIKLLEHSKHMNFINMDSAVVRRAIFGVVLVVSALYAANYLKRGWFPWDEGTLAQSAESVLRGELPHEDFAEIYTGGLAYVNSIAFRLFGTNLASMRYMLFLFFLLWVSSFYFVTRRFVSPTAAAAVTLLSVAWSVPNYSAAMPSWYNLFFATFGLLALLHYMESQNRWWLVAAGICGGTSFLFKISGLYFVSGVLLFLLFREVVTSRTQRVSGLETGVYRIFLTLALLIYEASVFVVLKQVANAATFPYFWIPNLAIGWAILFCELFSSEDKGQRFLFLLRDLVPFVAGVVLPIAIFLVPYVLTGSVLQFFHGISGSVREHLGAVSSKPPVVMMALGLSANLLFGAVVFLIGAKFAKAVGVFFLLGTPIELFLVRVAPHMDRTIWATMWSFLPLIVVVGTGLLSYWSKQYRLNSVDQQKLLLVLSVCATTNLIQYPYSTPSYYCYVAPLAFLSAAAISSYLHSPPKWVIAAVLSFSTLYMPLIVTPGFVMNMGQAYHPDTQTATLEGSRGGHLRVDLSSVQTYEKLSALVKQHARGTYIYATPNCPEVYFLYGFRDPTIAVSHNPNTVYPSDPNSAIIEALRLHGVNLVVLNNNPWYAASIPPDLRVALDQEFPGRAVVDRFEVRWKL
jgi:hypothetical protein